MEPVTRSEMDPDTGLMVPVPVNYEGIPVDLLPEELAAEPHQPMVTRQQYRLARMVLDQLAPGYYVKCAGSCRGWYTGDRQFVRTPDGLPYCMNCKGEIR